MTDPVFDKEGNLTNQDELTREEVASAYQVKNREVFERAKLEETKRSEAEANLAKAKADLEEAKKTASPPVENQKSPQQDPDELRLIARGLSDEEINEAKDIAKGKGVSLLEALKTPLFQLFQANMQEEKKKEAAKLGASSGSGQTVSVKGIKSGMTKEEHEAVWREALGKKPAA